MGGHEAFLSIIRATCYDTQFILCLASGLLLLYLESAAAPACQKAKHHLQAFFNSRLDYDFDQTALVISTKQTEEEKKKNGRRSKDKSTNVAMSMFPLVFREARTIFWRPFTYTPETTTCIEYA